MPPELLVGAASADDAAVYKLNDSQAIVATVDVIEPLVDDPNLFGRIAAANALSDVFAMGGEPLLALNVCCFPDTGVDTSVLAEILTGAATVAAEVGCVVAGGHTVRDTHIKFGLSVVGLVHPARVLCNNTARVGDRLILTKPLGTGILTGAMRKNRADHTAFAQACDQMATTNAVAARVARPFDISAMTDITGFGLAGHGLEMAEGSDVELHFDAQALPVFPQVLALIEGGVGTGMAKKTASHVGGRLAAGAGVDPHVRTLCFDPQTSGGLLMAIAPEQADEAVANLRAAGVEAACIVGEVRAWSEKLTRVVLRRGD